MHSPAARRGESGLKHLARSAAFIPVLVVAIVAAFAAEGRVFAGEAARLSDATPWHDFPVVAIVPGQTLVSSRLELLACAALETAALAALLRYWRPMPARRWELAIVALGAAALYAIAFGSRAATSADMYAYIAYAKLPSLGAAYAPPAHALPAAFRAINRLWGDPLVPAVYGPAWIGLDRAMLAGATSLAQAVLRLRIGNAAAYALLGYALYRLRTPPAVLAVYALNPGLVRVFIADAHNDLAGIALLVAGFACARAGRRQRAAAPAALALFAAASMMKLPFLLVAALGISPAGGVLRRAAGVVAFVGASFAVSLWWTHGAYLSALRAVAAANTGGGALRVAHVVAALAAVATVGAYVVLRRAVRVGTWILPTTAANLYPWYLGWGLPYLVGIGLDVGGYLVALPLLTLFVGTFWTQLGYGLLGACALGTLVADLREARAGQSPRETHGSAK